MSQLGRTKDQDIAAVGLPGRDRYNAFVALAFDETKRGGDYVKGQLFATLALAEATYMCEPTERLEITGAITVDS